MELAARAVDQLTTESDGQARTQSPSDINHSVRLVRHNSKHRTIRLNGFNGHNAHLLLSKTDHSKHTDRVLAFGQRTAWNRVEVTLCRSRNRN
eukprot:scaffold24381_cov21-Prasinocladus_malaysianus.AAC.1